ncbi:MAG: GTP cyclohydrolase I FolE [Halothiobacillus sp. 14-56-357]|jgi:GTP cyclohydrolase I|uniref:GTP cyclohydrolase I FolE n=1 Tax=Halothiobacillus sp. 15-55-196 TaxID=1970382 RepID=UPI000BD3B673|nr:GTP cyclohydrolase I FolE [Halothiobacillus sp. 15-55-196]OZB35462.1 MAG: GTP cyclohydrolase I FolE [Halothiobacillus sp. 15-55-196]OZB55962.1 MAG: GTP cyclohydrolase I FolE [Halothiobacillus sp. 14-56-357]OZB77607.1 MAG: GTP cyclohydrolase I FolE [Halothiobacillus sp. 13-55-115]
MSPLHEDDFPEPLDQNPTRIATIEAAVHQILDALGEDPNREGLQDTPKRVAKALLYLTHGLNKPLQSAIGNALFASNNDEMVVVRNIEFYSLCEHHMLPIIGHVDIGYIPQGKVIGLSKLARIVDLYARRLQIQENMTQQIADAVQQSTDARGVAVQVRAAHMCMAMRGVEKVNAETITSMMLGTFRSDARARNEFLQLIGQGAGRGHL